MIRHEDVAVQVEAVALAGSFQDVFEDCAGMIVVEIGETVVAGEGNKVVVAGSLVTLEAAGHDALFVSELRLGWTVHCVLAMSGSEGLCGELCVAWLL